MKRLKRIDTLFLSMGLLILIHGFIFREHVWDVPIHDTYFVIVHSHVAIALFLIHVLYTIVYFLINKYQKYALGLLHFIFHSLPFVHYLLSSLFYIALGGYNQRRYYSNPDNDTFFDTLFSDPIYPILLLFMLGQFLFLINIVFSIVGAIKVRFNQQ
jgi:heme/copper-type cytochrome/quinol oxidase subunit 1